MGEGEQGGTKLKGVVPVGTAGLAYGQNPLIGLVLQIGRSEGQQSREGGLLGLVDAGTGRDLGVRLHQLNRPAVSERGADGVIPLGGATVATLWAPGTSAIGPLDTFPSTENRA